MLTVRCHGRFLLGAGEAQTHEPRSGTMETLGVNAGAR